LTNSRNGKILKIQTPEVTVLKRKTPEMAKPKEKNS